MRSFDKEFVIRWAFIGSDILRTWDLWKNIEEIMTFLRNDDFPSVGNDKFDYSSHY